MSKNSIKTGSRIAKIASSKMRNSKSKVIRKLAASTLVNTKKHS